MSNLPGFDQWETATADVLRDYVKHLLQSRESDIALLNRLQQERDAARAEVAEQRSRNAALRTGMDQLAAALTRFTAEVEAVVGEREERKEGER